MAIADTWVDLGAVWTYTPGAGETRCIEYLENGIVMGGAQKKLWRSTDYGTTWTEIAWVDPGRVYQWMDILYVGAGIVLAMISGYPYGSFHTFRSTDYGLTWSDLGHIAPGIDDLQKIVNCGAGVILTYQFVGGAQVRSTDSGATWAVETGLFVRPVWGAAYDSGTGTLVACTAGWPNGGEILRSTNKGVSYTTVLETGVGGAEFAGGVCSLGGGIWLVGRWTSLGTRVYRSTNDGLNWTIISAVPGDQNGVWEFINFTGGHVALFDIAAGGVRIFVSHDYGATWADSLMGGIYSGLFDGTYCAGTLGLICGDLNHVYSSGSVNDPEVIANATPKVGHRWRKFDGDATWTDFWSMFYTQGAGTNRPLYLYNEVSDQIILKIDPADNILQVHKSIFIYEELRLRGIGEYYSGFESAEVASNCIWVLPVADGSANQVIKTSGSKVLSFVNLYHSLLEGTYHADTVTGTPVLGDIIIANATPKWIQRAGNITTTKKFLRQTGTGTISAEPDWDVLEAGDMVAHALDGAKHTVAGLNAGHFLKALSATTFGFAAHGLSLDDLGDVNAGTPGSGDVLTWDPTPGEWVPLPPGAGSIALDNLTDVNAAAPNDLDVLTWDSVPGEWIASPPAGGGALDDLSDVNAPTPNDLDVLTWDAVPGEWIAAPAAGGGALDDLSDVNAPSPSDEDVLTWDAGTSKWIAAAIPSFVVDEEAICFYDEFADASRYWTWYDMNLSAAKTIVESGSVLTIAVTAGTTTDIWAGANSAPSALMGVLEGCCRIETKINNQTVNTDTGRGVYLAIPSGTTPGSYYHVFLCRNTAGVAVEFSGVASVYTDTDTTLPMWFRIDILTLADMRIFRFYKSTNGTSWTLVYSATNEMNVLQGRHMSVGLYVKNWTGNAVSCPFEYFKQYRPLGPG